MGYETTGTVIVDGRRYCGTARLESTELAFRGETRLTIPFGDIADARAEGGTLIVTGRDGRVVFDIGPTAAKWAARITHPPTRLDKLGVKPGMRVGLIDILDEGLPREIESTGAVIVDGRASELDFLFFGVRGLKDLGRLSTFARRLKPSGAIWLIRAKGKGAPVSEAETMAAGKRAGLVDVKVVSFSSTHSAEKYVIPVEKRGAAGRSSSPRSRRSGSASSRGRT